MRERRRKRKKKQGKKEEKKDNVVVRTVVVSSERIGFRAFLALAEVEREYSQMLRELVDFAYENSVKSYAKLHALKYREMRNKYPDLPSHYIYTVNRDAVTRIKSFLAKKERGEARTDRPQVKNVTVWLDDHLWKPEGCTAVKISTKRGWVTVELKPHKQFWRYANGGWAMSSDARFKLDHRKRIIYFYLTFRREVESYQSKGFLPVDVNENNVTALVDGTAYLLETDIRNITLGYYYRRKRIRERNDNANRRKAMNKLREGKRRRTYGGRSPTSSCRLRARGATPSFLKNWATGLLRT